MKFLWILLFGGVTRLTEAPVDLLQGPYEFVLRKPISALTSEASLEIDVSAMVPKAELTLDLSRGWIDKNIKAGCVQATLKGRGVVSTKFEFNGRSSFAPGKVYLILTSPKGALVGPQFTSVFLTSCTPLNNVVIYWRNYRL